MFIFKCINAARVIARELPCYRVIDLEGNPIVDEPEVQRWGLDTESIIDEGTEGITQTSWWHMSQC